MAQLIIYTDGAARGNPGPGGYGAILMWGNHRKELSQGYKHTTNNRMELMAVIAALRALTKPGLDVTVCSDSSYVVNAIEKRLAEELDPDWLQRQKECGPVARIRKAGRAAPGKNGMGKGSC